MTTFWKFFIFSLPIEPILLKLFNQKPICFWATLSWGCYCLYDDY